MTGAAGSLTFVWLGMVLAISFLEAPLKFRAPGITIPLGVGIGRLVFRALNRIEMALALAIVVLVVSADASTTVLALTAGVCAMLAVQIAWIRPSLNRQSDKAMAGTAEVRPRSRQHLRYVALEVVKVAGLIGLGIALATS